MKTVKTIVLLAAAAATITVSSEALAGRAAEQVPDRTALLALARDGKSQEAWLAWGKLDNGTDKQRLGLELAVELKQISLGLDFYDQITAAGATPDRTLLTALAVATAADLAGSSNIEARAAACGAALLVRREHVPCRSALDGMVGREGSIDQMYAAYALANAGLRPSPALFDRITRNLPTTMRLFLARSATRLPDAERLGLLRPLLLNQDVQTQYQTMQALAILTGPDVLAALKSSTPVGSAAAPRLVALARHGDAASLLEVSQALDNYTGYLQVQAARAVADARDGRGVEKLRAVARGPVDLDRIYAAEALAAFDPATARSVLSESLDTGSPAIQQAAMRVAGLTGMGMERRIYRRLTDPSPDIRAQAVASIIETLAPRSASSSPARDPAGPAPR